MGEASHPISPIFRPLASQAWESRVKELNLWPQKGQKNGPTPSQEELEFLASFPIFCVSREQLCPSGHPALHSLPPALSTPYQ